MPLVLRCRPLLVLTLLLVLASCGKDEANKPTTNASNARGEPILQTLAETAATDAAAAGVVTLTLISPANVEAVGGMAGEIMDATMTELELIGAAGSPGMTPAAPAPLYRLAGWKPEDRLRTQMNLKPYNQPLYNQPFYNQTEQFPINQTLVCVNGGGMTIQGIYYHNTFGNMSATHQGNHQQYINVTASFDGCGNGTATLWGSVLINVSDFSDGTFSDTDIHYSLQWDQYLDGGLVLQEVSSGTAYNFTFRNQELRNIVSDYDYGTQIQTYPLYSVAGSFTLDSEHCSTSQSSVTETPVWDCMTLP